MTSSRFIGQSVAIGGVLAEGSGYPRIAKPGRLPLTEPSGCQRSSVFMKASEHV